LIERFRPTTSSVPLERHMNSNSVSRRQFVLAGAAATAGVAIFGGTRSVATAMEDASNRLAFTAAGKGYHFDTGVLRGTLRKNGNSVGLQPAEDVASGAALAGEYTLFAPYRLLTPQRRFLPDARDWSSDAHPLELTAVYRFSGPNVLDFQATVKPQRALPKFELFLASYFAGYPASSVYVQNALQTDGKPGFVEATRQAGDWQMFPRDDEAVRVITDGRWNCEPNPVAWKIRPRLAAPLALRRDVQRGLTALIMAPQLFGRDLMAGETASARARLVIGKAITDQQAIALYEAYQKELL
jgi:hypothetical protein